MSQRSLLRWLRRKLGPLGFNYVGPTAGGHHRWQHPSLPVPFITIARPGDPRGLMNTISTARRLVRGAGSSVELNRVPPQKG